MLRVVGVGETRKTLICRHHCWVSTTTVYFEVIPNPMSSPIIPHRIDSKIYIGKI